jgi:hypothetical protein
MVVKAMSFIVGLCIIIAAIAGAFACLLFRRRFWLPLSANVTVFVGCTIWFLRLAGNIIPDNDLASFQPSGPGPDLADRRSGTQATQC